MKESDDILKQSVEARGNIILRDYSVREEVCFISRFDGVAAVRNISPRRSTRSFNLVMIAN